MVIIKYYNVRVDRGQVESLHRFNVTMESTERNKTMNAIIDTDKLEAERTAIIRKEMIGEIVGGIILLATLALGLFLVTAGTDYHWC